MLCDKQITYFACACMLAYLNSACAYTKTIDTHVTSYEGKETMNNQSKKYLFNTHDKYGTPVILEAFKTTMVASDFSDTMKHVWEIAKPAYTPVETEFLRAHPDVVGHDNYFKPFEPLFVNGLETVDWKLVEQKTEEILKSHFVFDTSTWPEDVIKKYAHDICFVITAKDDSTQKLLGVITFLVRPCYAPGDIKVMIFAIDPLYHNRGLGKILMSSIFRIVPEIKRIFLCTRVTNQNALRAYRNWGFIDDKNPVLDHAFNLNHWTFLEYKIEQANILQKTAGLII